ncbi:S41 family peptidase [Aquimarina brevivitae]|uniref:Peptidase S41-like protein n=1 Tax=Aquimarina brevivitae TaxID=323412 RepID=A0A4Q7P231_9FLAO|nr:S41 family peptidase [Aquimarina brevivitae]RZS93936.1 peptidase S41-like protein [Aquimarina brevivitae]
MTKFLNPLLTTFLAITAISSIQAQDCLCSELYEKAVATYEQDYSLFIYKVTDENRDLYTAHKQVMRAKANKTIGVSDCRAVLEEYLQFFRDGHTYIINKSTSEINEEHIEISEAEYKEEYVKNNYNLNPIFGIWKSGNYTVAIIPNPEGSTTVRDFVGVITASGSSNWEPSDIKFEITTTYGKPYKIKYMMGDHSIKNTTGQLLSRSTLEIDGLQWKKIWPTTTAEPNRDAIATKFNEFHLTYVDKIPYLRLPDFYSVQPSFVDSLLQAHHTNIIKADIMIVDVRGNKGGNDATYFPVLPYMLNGPIKLPASGFWLSDYNIQTFMDYDTGEPNKKVEDYTETEKAGYDLMMANKGTAFFDYPEYAFTFKADTLYNGPKKVIMLIDKETASSGETFVYRANQSNKVVVYGQNTAGVVDGFNGLSKDIGCFEVVFPSSYRAKDIKENPIDPYGIAPDVFVDEKVDIIPYAIAHMKELLKNTRQ